MPPPLENTAARARALAHEAGELRTQLSRSLQRQEEAVRLVRELSDANAALKAELASTRRAAAANAAAQRARAADAAERARARAAGVVAHLQRLQGALAGTGGVGGECDAQAAAAALRDVAGGLAALLSELQVATAAAGEEEEQGADSGGELGELRRQARGLLHELVALQAERAAVQLEQETALRAARAEAAALCGALNAQARDAAAAAALVAGRACCSGSGEGGKEAGAGGSGAEVAGRGGGGAAKGRGGGGGGGSPAALLLAQAGQALQQLAALQQHDVGAARV